MIAEEYQSFKSLKNLVYDAENSERRRVFKVLRTATPEPLGVMINSLQRGTYIRPHSHLDVEILASIEGDLGVIIFDRLGNPTSQTILKALEGSVRIPGGDYHTAMALTPCNILIEVYGGIFDPKNYKLFASWAPEEGTEEARSLVQKLQDSFR